MFFFKTLHAFFLLSSNHKVVLTLLFDFGHATKGVSSCSREVEGLDPHVGGVVNALARQRHCVFIILEVLLQRDPPVVISELFVKVPHRIPRTEKRNIPQRAVFLIFPHGEHSPSRYGKMTMRVLVAV